MAPRDSVLVCILVWRPGECRLEGRSSQAQQDSSMAWLASATAPGRPHLSLWSPTRVGPLLELSEREGVLASVWSTLPLSSVSSSLSFFLSLCPLFTWQIPVPWTLAFFMAKVLLLWAAHDICTSPCSAEHCPVIRWLLGCHFCH